MSKPETKSPIKKCKASKAYKSYIEYGKPKPVAIDHKKVL